MNIGITWIELERRHKTTHINDYAHIFDDNPVHCDVKWGHLMLAASDFYPAVR